MQPLPTAEWEEEVEARLSSLPLPSLRAEPPPPEDGDVLFARDATQACLAAATQHPEDARARAWLRYWSGTAEARAASPARARWRRALLGSKVELTERDLSFAAAQKELRQASHAPVRQGLEAGLEATCAKVLPALSSELEARGFGFSLLGTTRKLDLAEVTQAARAALAVSADGYWDYLGYALRKVDSGLRPFPGGRPGGQDLRLAEEAFHLGGPLGGSVSGANRCLEELGFDPRAGRRISWAQATADDAQVWAPRLPEQVRVEVPVRQSVGYFADVLGSLGQAQAAALTDASLGLGRRRLGDPAHGLGVAALLESFGRDGAFARRYLDLGPLHCKDLAQAMTFRALAGVRRVCAQWLSTQTLLQSGLTEEAVETSVALLRNSLGILVGPGALLATWAPPSVWLDRLRGLTLAAGARGVLRARFDEDYWRNPAAGVLLHGVLTRGGPADAAGSSELFAAPAPVAELARDLCRAL